MIIFVNVLGGKEKGERREEETCTRRKGTQEEGKRRERKG